MVANGGERLECEVHVEHVSKFKYFGSVLNGSGTYGAECSRKVASGRMVADAIRSLVNATDLQIECSRILHETLLLLVLMYGSETMLWKEK